MPTLKSRYRGAMLGVLAGDAGGAPYENSRAASIAEDFEKRGGLKLFDYIEPFKNKRHVEAGHPTDDSELTAALAHALVDLPQFRPDAVYYRLRGFIHGHGTEPRRSILTEGKAYGSGGTLRAALRAETYTQSFDMFREGSVPMVPSNGSLMRCIPIPLRYHGHRKSVIEYAWRQSVVTHIDPEAQAACIAYSIMADNLLDGAPPAHAWHATYDALNELAGQAKEFREGILSLAIRQLLVTQMTKPTEDEIWPLTSYVTLSFRIAMWALLDATSFLDGITKAISVGGDVDTYGAIAGGLLGAHCGIEGIPEDWRKTLIGADRMEVLAENLYARSLSE